MRAHSDGALLHMPPPVDLDIDRCVSVCVTAEALCVYARVRYAWVRVCAPAIVSVCVWSPHQRFPASVFSRPHHHFETGVGRRSTHPYIVLCIHTHVHTHMRAHTQSRSHPLDLSRSDTEYTHTHTHTHTHTRPHTHTSTHTQRRLAANVPAALRDPGLLQLCLSPLPLVSLSSKTPWDRMRGVMSRLVYHMYSFSYSTGGAFVLFFCVCCLVRSLSRESAHGHTHKSTCPPFFRLYI